MTEPQKTEAEIKAETDAAAKATADKAAADKAAGDAGGNDRPSLERALSIQAEKKNAEIDALTKKLNAQAAADIKTKEDKLKADNKLQELLDTRDAKIKEMMDKSTAASRALLEAAAKEKLRDFGMQRALSLAGAVAGLPADATAESLDAWVAQVKVGNEAEFTAPLNPVKIPGTPDPAVNETGADLESRLKSDDNKVRAAAFNEQFKKDIGELS